MTLNNSINKACLISFLDLFAVGLIFPVLAPYIRSLGASHITVGVLSSAYSILQVLTGPIIGSWSDIRGRKPVFIITLLLSLVCYFCLGLCNSIYSIFFFRLLLGIFKHTQTLNKAIVVDIIGSKDSSRIFGKVTAFGSLGFVVGPAIGGNLLELKNGFTYICCLSSLLFALNIVLVSNLPDKTHLKSSTEISPKIILNELTKSINDLSKVDWKNHWVSFLLKFCFILSTTIFFVNQSLLMTEKYHLNHQTVGYIISSISSIGAVVALLSGWITKTFYKNSTNICNDRALHSFTALTFCFICFYFTNNFYILFLTLIPFGISNGLLRIVTIEMTYEKDVIKERGSMTGASDSMMALGRFLAPLTAGFIGDWFGESGVMLYAMVPSLLATIVCLYVKFSRRHEKIKSM